MIKISVITVCFNSAATLEDTLASVATQQYPHKEHIVIDGGSTDKTLEILGHSSGVDWISEPDRGIYDAMNKGIARASGDIIGFLNADDMYRDATILSRVAAVFADKQVDACFADLIYVDQHDTDKIIRYWKSKPYRHGLFRGGWMPAHPTFFVRRQVYEQYGDFDLNFPRQSDFDLTMRFLEIHKIKSVYVPEIWIKMRMGGVSNNSLSGIVKGNLEAYRACRKNGLNVNMPGFIFCKLLSRIPQFFSRPTP
ncbi:MAG: glycosyltransferase family 2 protein [Methylococcales bacterium]|nr:glycosyltransferase family 2 protein [Methylococcales bacterium]